MTTNKIKPNQSSLDMVLMATGTLEAAMQLMATNELSITHIPDIGAVYVVPDKAVTDTTTLSYLKQNNIEIGTKGD